jgi:hypothetical protein
MDVTWTPVEFPEPEEIASGIGNTLTLNPTTPVQAAALKALGGTDNGQYRWYLLQTDFNISLANLSNAQVIDGIEIIIPKSRYRAKVCIGNLFNTEDVQDEFGDALIDYAQNQTEPKPFKSSRPISEEMDEMFGAVLEHLTKVAPNVHFHWVDGQFLFVGSTEATNEFYGAALSILEQKHEFMGGFLI